MTVIPYEAAPASPRRARSRSLWLKLLGPAFAVSIGYIDPGNWATDLGAGSYGYALIWVVFAANAIAVVLQLAVSRVTLDAGNDLGTLIAERWPRLKVTFWSIFQGAAIATDLAEFSGIVLGVRLLCHVSLVASVLIGLAIVGLVLTCTRRTAKHLEYVLVGAVVLIAAGCLANIPMLAPDWRAIAVGSVVPRIPDAGAIVLVVGIIGATVMPHNLFLHSSLLLAEFRGCDRAEAARRNAFFTRETIVALNVAAVINAAILVIGVALHGAGGSIEQAFDQLLKFGVVASVVFGAALLVSGIASSLTATVAGDSIFAAFSPVRAAAGVRRAVTLVPAAFVIAAGANIMQLLVWSQVVLAFELPVVVVPLLILMFEARPIGGALRTKALAFAAVAASAICIAFDAVMVVQLL